MITEAKVPRFILLESEKTTKHPKGATTKNVKKTTKGKADEGINDGKSVSAKGQMDGECQTTALHIASSVQNVCS